MTNGRSVTARRSRASLPATLAAVLVMAACGGDAEGDEGEDPASDKSRGAGSLTSVSPLTGAPIGDAAPAHPVMVVKIDNTGSAEPQYGLGEADLVVEELVEGGSTRLAAMFWEKTPERVGPLRSIRATDIGIVRPIGAVLVASGGAAKTVRSIADAQITLLRESEDPGYSRDESRSAPYNLMMNLEELAALLEATPPPSAYLPFGPADSWAGGKPAMDVSATFSAAHTTEWRFEKGTGWVRPGSLADQGDDFVPDTVLVLRVDVGDAGYRDPAGNPVPETEFFGEGEATVFHDGEAVEGRWSKDGAEGQLQLSTRDGEYLAVPVGHTWVELVPKGSGSLTYSK